MSFNRACRSMLLLVVLAACLNSPATHAADVPDLDGEEADMRNPVQVYVLLGQSNMRGAGKINQ